MEDNFSPEHSLRLIQSMIDKTKCDLSENRVYFLLWGWLSFSAILGQFVLKVLVGYERHYLVWLITIPAVFITIWYSYRQERRVSHRTYVGDSMSHLWTGIGVSFFILSFIVSNLRGGWLHAWPLFILFYGLGTFVSGRMLQFRPLVIGGIFNWGLAMVAVYVAFDYQLLLAALAILTSYIIPGHLLSSTKTVSHA